MSDWKPIDNGTSAYDLGDGRVLVRAWSTGTALAVVPDVRIEEVKGQGYRLVGTRQRCDQLIENMQEIIEDTEERPEDEARLGFSSDQVWNVFARALLFLLKRTKE